MADRIDEAEIVREVHDRYTACVDFEGQSRAAWVDDMKFRHGDARNHWQWNSQDYESRNKAGSMSLPTMTINKTQAHCLLVENQARQSQMGIKINATGFGSTEKAADALEGIVRHVEYQSNCQQNAYMNAFSHAITAGIGWVHWRSDYVRGADSFDQDLFCDSVLNPLDVYSDPTCQQPDHSDMQWAMLVTNMPRQQFEREYPREDADKLEDMAVIAAIDDGQYKDWEGKEVVRVARYYRRSYDKDTLYDVTPTILGIYQQMQAVAPQQLAVPAESDDAPTTGGLAPDQASPNSTVQKTAPLKPGPMRASKMPEGLDEVCKAFKARSRPVEEPRVEWFLIGGSRLIDHGDTVFKRIPLAPCIGVETVIEGKLDRHGLTRNLIDPQRLMNYAASKFAEGLAAQTQTPWLAESRSVANHLTAWENANVKPPAILLYDSVDEDGAEINVDKPTKITPPEMSQGFMSLFESADQQMQAVSGQYQAELGAPGNEKSGTAINQRQRQGDTANYHFTDNFGMFLRLSGLIIMDAFPAVYDTARVLQIMGLDGDTQQAVLDPSLTTAHQVVHPPGTPPVDPQMDPDKQMKIQGAILAINPNIGRYDVEADVGPAFATRRQDASNAYIQIAQAWPPFMEKAADIVFRAMDEPMSDELADRFKPASDDPQLKQAMQHIQMLSTQNAQLMQQVKAKNDNLQHDQIVDLMKHDNEKSKIEIDRFRAITDRLSDLKDSNPNDVVPVLREAVMEVLKGRMPLGTSLPDMPAEAASMPQPAPNPQGATPQ